MMKDHVKTQTNHQTIYIPHIKKSIGFLDVHGFPLDPRLQVRRVCLQGMAQHVGLHTSLRKVSVSQHVRDHYFEVKMLEKKRFGIVGIFLIIGAECLVRTYTLTPRHTIIKRMA